MAVDIKDVEQVAQELQQKFDDFKAKNDKRVDAIEQEKGKLAGQVETLNGKLSELENLKSDLEKELLELKRPAGGAQNKLATEHKEAFVGFLRKGREDGLRDLERKALQVGTDEDGGYAVPEELDRNILNLLKDEVVMRQEATVITVGGSDYKKLVNLGGTASGWVGETDTRSQTATSRLELIEPLMGEIYGNPQATQKMLDDAFFNVEAWINSELATEFAEQEEIAFTSGDGTKKPKGFLAYESTDETDKVRAFGKLQHIVSGEATAVTADAIIKLIYTLRKAHRTGAKFMMNNNSLFAIRLLKDTEGNKADYYFLTNGADSANVEKAALADMWQGIMVEKKNNALCVITVFGATTCETNMPIEKVNLNISGDSSFQQALLYNGRVGNKINIGYREFSANTARPAFNNDVEYDLAESKTIGYKGAKFEVLDASNQSIRYRVISNFR
ncbi:phage major capsid protein [Escherichia coli]|nr:phage major capsid protein [Escherichia coli]